MLSIIALTLVVSGSAILLAALLGVPLGAWIGLTQFVGRKWITTLIYTGMALPPIVVGLIVYLLLSRQGALGSFKALFTVPAMIFAQFILALPLVIGVTMQALADLDPQLPPQLAALGATPAQIRWAMLREAQSGVILGILAGFGAAISEVGAVMLVGGNIAGKTRVLTTAILLEVRQGNFEYALGLGAVLLSLSFAINALIIFGRKSR